MWDPGPGIVGRVHFHLDHLQHVEDVWDPGPGIVGRVHQEADDLKVPDEAHAQEKPEM